MYLKKIVTAKLVLLYSFALNAQVKLPRLVRDSMILQRDAPVNIWGWSAPNEKISLRFKNKNYKTRADKTGNWQVKLAATAAGGPYTIDIEASNKISLKEILLAMYGFAAGKAIWCTR
jgi:sialate O-acetylesterase